MSDRTSRREFLSQAALGSLAFTMGCTLDPKSGDVPDEDPLDSAAVDTAAVDTAVVDSGTAEELDPWGDMPTECPDPTPESGTGPFYRPDAPTRSILNIFAEDGVPMRIYFRLLDTSCAPIVGAMCEIWHCAPEAQYDMTSTDMRFYGTVYTDAEGKGYMESIKPPTYIDDAGTHSPHVHFQVTAAGYKTVAFQVRFAGDEGVPPEEKNPVAELVEDADGFMCDNFNFVMATA